MKFCSHLDEIIVWDSCLNFGLTMFHLFIIHYMIMAAAQVAKIALMHLIWVHFITSVVNITKTAVEAKHFTNVATQLAAGSIVKLQSTMEPKDYLSPPFLLEVHTGHVESLLSDKLRVWVEKPIIPSAYLLLWRVLSHLFSWKPTDICGLKRKLCEISSMNSKSS